MIYTQTIQTILRFVKKKTKKLNNKNQKQIKIIKIKTSFYFFINFFLYSKEKNTIKMHFIFSYYYKYCFIH